jgi:hypothetical protein
LNDRNLNACFVVLTAFLQLRNACHPLKNGCKDNTNTNVVSIEGHYLHIWEIYHKESLKSARLAVSPLHPK